MSASDDLERAAMHMSASAYLRGVQFAADEAYARVAELEKKILGANPMEKACLRTACKAMEVHAESLEAAIETARKELGC